MVTSKSELRRRAAFRARVRQMLEAGFSVSRIAKETKKSVLHTTRIAKQEQAAIDEADLALTARTDVMDACSLQSDHHDV